jgi:hypothetical protein
VGFDEQHGISLPALTMKSHAKTPRREEKFTFLRLGGLAEPKTYERIRF